jgi:hypothetical protein
MLRDGTVLADHFVSFDESSLILSKANRSVKLRASDVARVLFQPEFEANSLTGGRTGVLMSNGDFIDGEFRGIEAGSIKISSVLLGQRRYELNRKVAAILLRDAASRPVPLEVIARDGSLWRPDRITSGRDSLVLSTLVLGERRLPVDEVIEIRRGEQLR